MPLIDLKCTHCGTTTEYLLKTSDTEPTQCKACGHTGGQQKVISSTNFQLKGTGWYDSRGSSISRPS